MSSVRGRSLSAERKARGHASRTEINTFVENCQLGDQVTIEWRIVSSSLAADAAATAATAWTEWNGAVIEKEHGEITVQYKDASGADMGPYVLPPATIPGGYVEIKKLSRSAPAFSFTQLRKRPLEEDGCNERRILEERKEVMRFGMEVMAFAKGEEPKRKTTVAEGLKIVDEGHEMYAPLQLFTYVQTLKMQATEQQRRAIITQLKMELLELLQTTGILSDGRRNNAEALANYNRCREDYLRWIEQSFELSLTTKDAWGLGYGLLFNLIDAIVVLKNPAKTGSSRELRQQFASPNAVIDIATYMNKFFNNFQARRQRGGASGESAFSSNDKAGQKHQRQPGTDTATGAAGERQCNRCHKWTIGPWRNHRCKGN
jgi:hypothetical protein